MDSWTPNHSDDGTYRCEACGCESFRPGAESCDCRADESGDFADPQETPPSEPSSDGAALEPGSSADSTEAALVAAQPLSADVARRLTAQIAAEQYELARALKNVAKRIAKVKKLSELTMLQAQTRAYDRAINALSETRKSAEAAFSQAEASQEVELLERREALAARLERLQAGQGRTAKERRH